MCYSSSEEPKVVKSKACNTDGESLCPIYSTPVTKSDLKATVFCDGGSDVSFISKEGAKRLKARKVKPIKIEIATLSGTECVSTYLYEIEFISPNGKKYPVTVFQLDTICDSCSQLDLNVFGSIFPQ